MQNNFLIPTWDTPTNVKALITYRYYNNHDFNLALHSNHTLSNPSFNREILNQYLPNMPYWLSQTHTDKIIDLDNEVLDSTQSFDASFTKQTNKVSIVMTADCIPVLITNTQGTFVSSVHAGWRGVLNQITLKAIAKSGGMAHELIVYIGPSICKHHFEVGEDVFNLFTTQDVKYTKYFKPDSNKYQCDLSGILIEQLTALGIKHLYTSNLCTICNNDLFYSYRLEKNTGRFASLIWLESK